MLPRHTLLALLAALQAYAVPLNINLGAYSPALVVGDGEISFGGAQNAGALMETLASGAAATAANQGQAANVQQAQGQQQAQAAGGEAQAQAPAAPPAPAAEATTANADEDPAQSIRKGLDGRTPNMAKREVLDDLEDQILEEARKIKIKREINGFRAALDYAKEAQKNQPKVELGSEGAGVGIVVSPGANIAANSASNGAPAAAERVKREIPEVAAEQKQGITLLAIAEI